MSEQTWLEKESGEFGYLVRARKHQDYDHIAEVEAYEIKGRADDLPMFEDARNETGGSLTEDRANWARYLHGSVKWDGCSNIIFDELLPSGGRTPSYLHFCGRQDAKQLADMMDAIYDLAFQAMGLQEEE